LQIPFSKYPDNRARVTACKKPDTEAPHGCTEQNAHADVGTWHDARYYLNGLIGQISSRHERHCARTLNAVAIRFAKEHRTTRHTRTWHRPDAQPIIASFIKNEVDLLDEARAVLKRHYGYDGFRPPAGSRSAPSPAVMRSC
jgi:hypothetical protein